MTASRLERLNIGKALPVMDNNQNLLEVHNKIDPFSLPPIRDVYEPLIGRETVRFNPFDGEIFILGQRNKQGQIIIDKLEPKKKSFWINFSHLDGAYSTSKKFYLEQGKHKVIENTEGIISSVIDNFPQFFEGDLNEQAVRNIINIICLNLVIKGKIKDGDNQTYIEHALHNHRGIRNGHYSEQENKSRLGSVVLDIINDLINKRGKSKNYSPILANLFVEQQIEKKFLLDLEKDFKKSISENLQPHFSSLKEIEKSLLQTFKKYFGYSIFRCSPIKQSAEVIQKGILEINRIIKEFGDWNPNKAMDKISELMIRIV